MQGSEENHRPSHTLGRLQDLTKSEAQKLKREWMRKLNEHREVAGNSRTLAGFWYEHFYDEEKKEVKHELKDKRPSTVRDMKWTMKKIWLPRFGARLLDAIGTLEVQRYLDGLKLSRRSVARYRAYLSSVFSSAIRLGHGARAWVDVQPRSIYQTTGRRPRKALRHANPSAGGRHP